MYAALSENVCVELLAMARQLGDRAEEAALLNMISQYQGLLGEWGDAEEAAHLFELKQYGNIYTRINNPTTAVLE